VVAGPEDSSFAGVRVTVGTSPHPVPAKTDGSRRPAPSCRAAGTCRGLRRRSTLQHTARHGASHGVTAAKEAETKEPWPLHVVMHVVMV
jgi:hypothetical protein